MRRAGRVVAEMHEAVRAASRPGVTTLELDAIARRVLDRRSARSNFLGYHGFPAVICTSVNDEVVHGIPSERVLEEGDHDLVAGFAIDAARQGQRRAPRLEGCLMRGDAPREGLRVRTAQTNDANAAAAGRRGDRNDGVVGGEH